MPKQFSKKKMTKTAIRNALLEQLEAQNKTASYYTDLVDDYMTYWDLKKRLQKDIQKNGVRYMTINGNGVESEKPNESIMNLNKTTATMLKILSDLNLREPSKVDGDLNDYM